MRRFEDFANKINHLSKGRTLVKVLKDNIEEIMLLINHNRRVLTTWNRNHGPAFINVLMECGEDVNKKFQKEIQGISLQWLILRMADALQEHGSRKLSGVIATYTATLLAVLQECNSVQEVIEMMDTNGIGPDQDLNLEEKG